MASMEVPLLEPIMGVWGHSPTFHIGLLVQSASADGHCVLPGEGRLSSNIIWILHNTILAF